MPDSPRTPAAANDLLLFTPVPFARLTARGWSSDVQRAFVDALARCGVVTVAAASVRRTARSAYALRRRPGAEGFAHAWDLAITLGRQDASLAILHGCFEPEPVPVIRRGRIIGMQTKFNEKLAISAIRVRPRAAARPSLPHVEKPLSPTEIDAIWGPPRTPAQPPSPRARRL